MSEFWLVVLLVGQPVKDCDLFAIEPVPMSDAVQAGEREARVAALEARLAAWEPPEKRLRFCLIFDRLPPSKEALRALTRSWPKYELLTKCPKDLRKTLFVRNARWCSASLGLIDVGSDSGSLITDESGCSVRVELRSGVWNATVTEACWIH